PLYYVRNSLASLHLANPQIQKKSTYTITLVGDSMTDILRSQEKEFREYFKKYYPTTFVDTLNYSIGSTNLLMLKDQLTKEAVIYGKKRPAILKKQFDIIVIESFGNNPLV